MSRSTPTSPRTERDTLTEVRNVIEENGNPAAVISKWLGLCTASDKYLQEIVEICTGPNGLDLVGWLVATRDSPTQHVALKQQLARLLCQNNPVVQEMFVSKLGFMPSLRQQVKRRIRSYFNALDDRDWKTCLDTFHTTFDADYTSMVGGDVLRGLPRDTNMQAWTGMLAGFKSTHHQIGNEIIDVVSPLENEVLFKAKVTATHFLPDPSVSEDQHFWCTGGKYEMLLRLIPTPGSPDAWRIVSIKYEEAWSKGPNLMEKAMDAVESQQKDRMMESTSRSPIKDPR